jgi:TolB protein
MDIRDLAWSPDGRQMAYWSGADKSSDIYVMNVDGSGQRRLDTGATDDRNPVWSRDGRHIAYVSRAESGALRLKVTAAAGGEVRCLGDKGVYINGIGTMAWTPDSRQIASLAQVQGRLTIVLAKAEAKGADEDCAPLTSALDPMGLDTYSLLWSPDNEHIAFTSNQSGQWGIFVLPANCLQPQQNCRNEQRRVSQAQGDSGYPAWSPDGKQIAYIVGLSRKPHIWLTDLEGNARPITHNRYSYWSPVWWR